MKKLAKLYLESPLTIEKPKLISELLNISYNAAYNLKARFLKLSRNRQLCPECLTPMIIPERELVCPKCGYSYIIPELTSNTNLNSDNMLYDLGSYRLRSGERKGQDRLLQESLDEIKSILECLSLREKILDEAGKLARKYVEVIYDGRATSINRFKVCVNTLAKLSTLEPQIKNVLNWYQWFGPLLLRSSDTLTKSTKSFSPIEGVLNIE
jgi:ribosomal protein S27AE